MKATLRGAKTLGRALRKRAELPGLDTAVSALGAELRARADVNLDQSDLPPALVARLKKNIKESFQVAGIYKLSSDDPLAAQVEDGTQRRGARPWLLPALMDTQRSARARFRALIKS